MGFVDIEKFVRHLFLRVGRQGYILTEDALNQEFNTFYTKLLTILNHLAALSDYLYFGG